MARAVSPALSRICAGVASWFSSMPSAMPLSCWAVIRADARTIGFVVRHGSGYLLAILSNSDATRLDLPRLRTDCVGDRTLGFLVSADAADGISTGISAADRAATVRVLASPTSRPGHLTRPGHVVPVRVPDWVAPGEI
jgi:3,4-dihydroxy 2-butanone 4-phosphate synthase/GTP cyclohydrolase II